MPKNQYERNQSLSQIIRERGENPADVFTEIAEENVLLKQLGITPEQVASQLMKEEENAEDKRKIFTFNDLPTVKRGC